MTEQRVEVPARPDVEVRRVVLRKWPTGADPAQVPPEEVVEMTYDPLGDTALVWVTERVWRGGQVVSVRRYITRR